MKLASPAHNTHPCTCSLLVYLTGGLAALLLTTLCTRLHSSPFVPSRVATTSITSEFGLLIKQQLYFDRYTKILAPTLDPLRDSRMQMQMKDQEGRAVGESEQEKEGAKKDPEGDKTTKDEGEEGEPGRGGRVGSDVGSQVGNDAAAGVEENDGERGVEAGSGVVSDVMMDNQYGEAGEEVGRGVAGEVAPAFSSGGLAAGASSDVVSSVDSEVGGGAKGTRNKSKKRKKNRKKDRRASSSSPPEIPLK